MTIRPPYSFWHFSDKNQGDNVATIETTRSDYPSNFQLPIDNVREKTTINTNHPDQIVYRMPNNPMTDEVKKVSCKVNIFTCYYYSNYYFF